MNTRHLTLAALLVFTAIPNAQADWQKAAGDLQGCYIKTMVADLSLPYALLECMDEVNAYCDASKFPDNCNYEAQLLYKQTIPPFQAEYDNYTRSINAGLEYKPVFFDIRKIR